MSAGVVIAVIAGVVPLWLMLGAVNNVVNELRRIAECAERDERRRAAFDEALR